MHSGVGQRLEGTPALTKKAYPSTYREMVGRRSRPPDEGCKSERELDALLTLAKRRKIARESQAKTDAAKEDPVDKLRRQMTTQLVPVFEEIAAKYAPHGFTLELDLSRFMAGERELTITMGFGQHTSELHGTVTSEMIAFHEIRRRGEFGGELASGPALRLRTLNADSFREFICSGLSRLMRAVMRTA